MSEKLYVARTGDHTHLQWSVPVIFLPGVMGSRLYFTGSDEHWNPHRETEMMHWVVSKADNVRSELHTDQAAEVMTDDTREPLQPEEQNLGWEGVAWEHYVPFLRFLRQSVLNLAQCPVHAVGYDWRQDIIDIAADVEPQVKQVLKNEEADHFILITHSMGGLVARAMLKRFSGLADKSLGVIHVVQPANGAAVAYRRFFTGAVKGMDGEWAFRKILGDTGDKYARIISGMTGPVQLLPNKSYTDRGNRPWLQYRENGKEKQWPGDVYTQYRDADSPPGLIDAQLRRENPEVQQDITERINAAEAFHDWLAHYKHPCTYTIYSTGQMTDMAIRFDPHVRPAGKRSKWVNRGANPVRRDQGDGTVPDSSGGALYPTQTDPWGQLTQDPLQPSPRQGRVDDVEHSAAMNDAGVRRRIVALLERILFDRIDMRSSI